MKKLNNYIQASQDLIEEFFVKYYNEWEPIKPSDYAYYISAIWLENHWFGVINVSDDYVNMEMIYTAIKYNIAVVRQ